MEEIQIKSIDSFISNNRTLAINAITLQRNNFEKISKIRSSLESKKQISIVPYVLTHLSGSLNYHRARHFWYFFIDDIFSSRRASRDTSPITSWVRSSPLMS